MDDDDPVPVLELLPPLDVLLLAGAAGALAGAAGAVLAAPVVLVSLDPLAAVVVVDDDELLPPVFLFELPEYWSEYQPPPFKMKLPELISRLAASLWHCGQTLIGSSVMR